MAYSGENIYFSFRDNFCELLPNVSFGSSEAAVFGRIVSGFFRRFFIGCDNFEHMNILYALCGGISESGHDVYVCENTDLPSFIFGIPLLSADCGIFISGSSLKMSFFEKSGFPVSDRTMSGIINSKPSEPAEKCGKIYTVTSFKNIYVNNIADSLSECHLPFPAGISCGRKSVRSLWLEFFSGEDDTLVFQISDDGLRVNAYSSQLGFVSFEKIMLAYSYLLVSRGNIVFIPENFHYSADLLNNGDMIKRFDYFDGVPETAVKQRFLCDPLYMCTQLAANREEFFSAVKSLPAAESVRREIVCSVTPDIPLDTPVQDGRGRIIITKSGKNRLSLLAQSYSNEAAAEICSSWTEKIRSIFSDAYNSENKK